MRASAVLVVSLFALTGCALEPKRPERMAENSVPACADVAYARARDAAINGYDRPTQLSIQQESYNSCVIWAKKSVLVELGRQ